MTTETSNYMIGTSVDPSGAEEGFDKTGAAAEKAEKRITGASERAGKSIAGIGDGASKGAEKAEKSLGNLTASIQRYNAQLESGGQKGAKYFESLADSRGLDKTNEAYQSAIAKARELEAQNQKLGVSAAQTAAAMRGVPAQFTDIITSLQGGQAPLTVLLQQGGQLKDMFGGTGNAAKALGGYVMGLVNPLTVTAAGATTLAYALYAGSKESSEFAKTLLVTGNQAGVTSGQLMAMAAAVSAVSGTQGNAADVLNQLAATGKVTSANLQQAAQAAVQFEKAGGQAAAETVKAFAELGKSPLEASLKLNESMGYLTKSTYAQIKALMDQGRETEAASVAQKAFADALGIRSGEMVKNLGLVEKSWSGIKGAITGAWDAIKAIGRETGVEGQTAATSQAIKNLSKQIELRGSYDASTPYGRETIAMGEQLRLLKEKHDLLQADERLLRNAAERQAQQTRAVEAQAKLDKDGLQYLDKKAKAEREINELRGLAITAGWTEVQIAERIAAIREKYKETGTGQDAGEAALAKQKATLEEAKQYAINLQRELAAVMAGDTSGFAKQTQAEKTAIELQEQLATGIKGVARANMEKQLAVAQATVEVEKSNRVAEQQIQIQKDLEKQRTVELKSLGADAVAIQAKTNALEAELAVRGKSKAAIEEAVLARWKENAADVESFKNSADVVAGIKAKIVEQEKYVKSLKATDYKVFNEHTDELLRSAQEQQKLYQDELQLTGLTAVERAKVVAQRAIELKYAKELDALDKSGLSDAEKETQRLKIQEAKRIESAAATGKVIQAEYERVSQQIEQSLTDALMRGFESGKGFATNLRDTVVNMFKTMVLRPIVSAIVSPIAAAAGGAVNAATGSFVSSAAGSAVGGSVLGGATLGSLGQYAATGFMNTVAGTGTAAGMSAGAAVGGANGAAMSIGAAAPWVLGALAVAALIKSLDDSGTMHSGGAAKWSAANGLATSNDVNPFGLGVAKTDYSQGGATVAQGIAMGLGQSLDKLAVTFGQKAGYNVAAAFADDSSRDKAWGALTIKNASGASVIDWTATQTSRWAPREFADGDAGLKEYTAAVAADVTKMIKGMDLPGWAQRFAAAIPDNATLEQLNAAMTQIADYPNTLLQQAGTTRDALVQTFTEGLMAGDATAAGQAVADQLVASIEQSLVGNAAGQIFDIVNAGIVTPMLDAILTGQAVSEAISEQAIAGVVAKAQAAAEALSILFNNEEFKAAMAAIRQNVGSALGSAGASLNYTPRYQPANRQAEEAAARAAEQARLQAEREAQAAAEAAARAAQQAAEEAARAAQQYQQALQDAQSYINGIARSISDFLSGLDAQAGGLESYARAAAAFSTQMVLARGGDRDALGNITGSASTLVETIRRESNSAAEATLRIGRVRGQLAGLPAQLSPEQFIVQSLSPVINQVPVPIVSGLGGVSSTVSGVGSSLGAALALNAYQVSAAVNTGFATWDANSDGLLTIDEFRAGMSGKATDSELTYWFDQLDRNDDGTISQLELIAAKTGGSVSFDPADPIYSVWEAIRQGTATSAFFLQDASNKLNAIQYYLGEPFRGTGSLKIRGETQAFAAGGVFSNSVVSSPTLFDLGLMGEAGPEAIMPLRRGSDGSLGVVAQVQMPDFSQYGRTTDHSAALVAEIRALREDNQAQARAMVQLQQRIVKLNERWDANGLPETRVVA